MSLADLKSDFAAHANEGEKQVAVVQTEEDERLVVKLQDYSGGEGKWFVGISVQDRAVNQEVTTPWSTDPDAGIGFPVEKIDDVIAALQAAKAMHERK